MKHIFLLTLVFLMVIPANATTYGVGGISFENNVTFVNMTDYYDIGNITLLPTVIINSDFEVDNDGDAPSNWTGTPNANSSVTVNSSTSAHLNNSLRLWATGHTYSTIVTQCISEVDAGETWNVIFYQKSSGGSNLYAKAHIGEYTSGVCSGSAIYVTSMNGVKTDTTFTRMEKNFTVHASINAAQLHLQGWNTWTGYAIEVFYDCFMFYDEAEPFSRMNGSSIFPIEDSTSGHQAKRFMINGTFGDGIRTKNISMRHSTDNISWSSYYSIQTNISPATWYDISANQTQYWQIKDESTTTNNSSTPITETVIFENKVFGAPSITSHFPTDLTPDVYENVNSSFNATANPSSNWRIRLNGTHIEWQNGTTDCIYYNETWLNDSSLNNITFEAHNTSDDSLYDTITWDVNVLLNSVDINVTYYDPDNLTANVIFDLSNKTAGLQTINISYSGTNASSEYCLCHPNGTAVQACVTATSEGETIWFNGSADRLPEATNYSINESAGTSTIIIPANSWGMVNNWTVTTNFSNIAANESNDVCYTYYNVTTGEWASHYPPYSWNSNYVVPLEASVMVYINAETTVTATIVTPANTNLYTGWNMLFVEGTDNETIADIKSDVGANCTAVWAYNSTAGAYTNSPTYSVQPCQGVLVYITQDMLWVRSDL